MTTATSRVSVVLLAYNSAGFICDAVDSVIAQRGADVECIVLDNGSRDNTFEVLQRSYGDHNAVRFLRVEAGLGYAGGNNAAAAQAGGDILLFLNDDCVLEKGAVAALLDDFGWRGSPAIVQCALTDACGQVWTDLGHFVDRWGFVEPVALPPTRSEEHAEPYRIFGAAGAALAVRSECFQELGGFDSALTFLFEETDLCWRANLRGWGVVGSGRAVARHRCMARYATEDPSRRESAYELFTRHRLRSLAVNSEAGGLGTALTIQACAALGFSLSQLLRGHPSRTRETVRALAWFVRHGGDTWKRRRQVQCARFVTDRQLIADGVMLRPSIRRMVRRARGDYGGRLSAEPTPTMAGCTGGGGEAR